MAGKMSPWGLRIAMTDDDAKILKVENARRTKEELKERLLRVKTLDIEEAKRARSSFSRFSGH
jgi:hypothetical protein